MTRRKSNTSSKSLDQLTAERIRAIFADPAAPKIVTKDLDRNIFRLHELANPTITDTPEGQAQLYADSALALRGKKTPERNRPDAEAVRAEIVALAEEYEPEEYRAARRVIAAYDAQDAREPAKGSGCYFFMEHYVDPMMNEASDNITCGSPHDELFTFLFVRAAREYRGDETPNRWTELLDVLTRAEEEEGFDFEQLHEEYKQRRAEISEAYRAERLAKPEPKDKLSDEWRYWKLRQVEHAFGPERMKPEGREAYNAAHDYFRELLAGLYNDEDFYNASHILPLLPQLIIARQQIDGIGQYERRMRAGMKGAEARKAKAAKK